MNNETRLQELETLSNGPNGIRQIAEVYDRVRRARSGEVAASVTIREMIDYIVEYEQPA